MADLDFGYRVCAFNRAAHGGVHVHGPDGTIQPVSVGSADEAERLVRVYAWIYPEGFTWDRFRRCLTWRSG